ncbi:hypothetical protein HOLleu_16871 [Holothuria leucospilota]|uniref:Uncharacterized protein n=1 Tax=Holothuria leucospilota TaxID=206669 RepID=A0A9Q1H840_HOLLE|nr:hypothetical protein HOLleu_16871 [Holothuria leucospilota]
MHNLSFYTWARGVRTCSALPMTILAENALTFKKRASDPLTPSDQNSTLYEQYSIHQPRIQPQNCQFVALISVEGYVKSCTCVMSRMVIDLYQIEFFFYLFPLPGCVVGIEADVLTSCERRNPVTVIGDPGKAALCIFSGATRIICRALEGASRGVARAFLMGVEVVPYLPTEKKKCRLKVLISDAVRTENLCDFRHCLHWWRGDLADGSYGRMADQLCLKESWKMEDDSLNRRLIDCLMEESYSLVYIEEDVASSFGCVYGCEVRWRLSMEIHIATNSLRREETKKLGKSFPFHGTFNFFLTVMFRNEIS